MGFTDAERLLAGGRSRVVIEDVTPAVDGGRFAVKRVVGESMVVEASVFADGHDAIAAVVEHRSPGDAAARESRLAPIGNDRWQALLPLAVPGRHTFAVVAWIDRFETWRRDLAKRLQAGQDVAIDGRVGVDLLLGFAAAAEAGSSDAAAALRDRAAQLARALESHGDVATIAQAPDLERLAASCDPRRFASRSVEIEVVVDRERARFGSWYEMFPRSTSPVPGRHGTLADCEARLPHVAAMGFDVVYLPPIHPIGRTNRKGRNNAPAAAPGDPGSPWAIGAETGGHDSIHPDLGTLGDFERLLARARDLGLEVALDLALQCSPDHPYVRERRDWFRTRPDGSVQYAENPPKKYQDIYPFDFECERYRELWAELLRVVELWIARGVRIFRVDNPHTKPFALWEWLIAEVKRQHPDVLFLAEAFTRPRPLHHLAKLGFTQSYTYFTWRNTKAEITAYFTELMASRVRDYLRPNLWPNTPDILPETLQHGGRPAFLARLVLAATLGASYGIYGPPFELCVREPLAPGGEEYLDSEKYEVRYWNLADPQSLRHVIARINRIRREHAALQQDGGLVFHEVDNDQLIAYSKQSEDRSSTVLVAVNLDPHHTHAGWLTLDLERLGLSARDGYQVHDLLSDARFAWYGRRNYIELNPGAMPAHVFAIRHRIRTEHQFDYYL